MSIQVLKEPMTGDSYRIPMPVTHLCRYQTTSYYICPRYGITMEREFASYCDRCGQCLNWKGYKNAEIVTNGNVPEQKSCPAMSDMAGQYGLGGLLAAGEFCIAFLYEFFIKRFKTVL